MALRETARSPAAEALLAGGLVVIVYLLTLSRNHSETEDSLVFALRVQGGDFDQFFEAPHMLYDWIGWLGYNAVRGLGITDDPVPPLQALNAVSAGVTVSVFWFVLRRVGLSRLPVFAAVGLYAASYSFWRNGVEAEVYTLSALALVLALLALIDAVDRLDHRSFALLGFAYGIAVLMHFTNVVFGAAVMTALVLVRRRVATRELVSLGGAFATVAASVVITGYAIAAIWLGLGSVGEFREWFTESTGEGQYGNLSPTAVAQGIVGGGRALIGAHFVFRLDALQDAIRERFPSKPLREETYLAADFGEATALVLTAAAVVAGLLAVALALLWVRRPVLEPRARMLARVCLAWLGPLVLLTVYWDPFNIELWYAAWIPASILLALPLADVRGVSARAVPVVVCLVGLVFVVNLAGSQLPQHDAARDYWHARASWYRNNVDNRDLVVANGYIWGSYLGYETAAETLDAAELAVRLGSANAAIAEIQRRIDATPGRVFFSEEAFYPYERSPEGCTGEPDVCAVGAEMLHVFEPRTIRVPATGEPERVWELTRRDSERVGARSG
jgi:Dolichyl-phosphate-mannose-protein mannosyltransferase